MQPENTDLPLFKWGEEDIAKRRLEEMKENDSNIPFVGAYGTEMPQTEKKDEQPKKITPKELRRAQGEANIENIRRDLDAHAKKFNLPRNQ